MKEYKVDKAGFQEVVQGSTLVVADFLSPFCGPCKKVHPLLEELEGRYEGKFRIVEVDITEESDLAMEQGVLSVPTLILFRDGKELDRNIGLPNPTALEKLVVKHLG